MSITSGFRHVAGLAACALALVMANAGAARRQSAASAGLDGTAVDAASGLPRPGARVAVVDHPLLHVQIPAWTSGSISQACCRAATACASTAAVSPRSCPSWDWPPVSIGRALALQRSGSASVLGVIGSTATPARHSSSARARSRITNSIKGDTAALGDDIPLQRRGIGALETTSAIGGIIDQGTLEPTAEQQFGFAQGWAAALTLQRGQSFMTLNFFDMAELAYRVALEADPEDGGFVVRIPAFPHAHTQGDTVEAALANAREAIELEIEVAREQGEHIPDPDADAAVGVERVVIVDSAG